MTDQAEIEKRVRDAQTRLANAESAMREASENAEQVLTDLRFANLNVLLFELEISMRKTEIANAKNLTSNDVEFLQVTNRSLPEVLEYLETNGVDLRQLVRDCRSKSTQPQGRAVTIVVDTESVFDYLKRERGQSSSQIVLAD